MIRTILLILSFILFPHLPSLGQVLLDYSNDNLLFPQFENNIRPSRFAGNWKVSLKHPVSGADVYTNIISISSPYEGYCETVGEEECRYKIRFKQDGEWKADYLGVTNTFSRGMNIGSQSLQFAHSYGVGGRWGADSKLNFSSHIGSGKWEYRDEDGEEVWERQLPKIDHVKFYAVDAIEGSLADSEVTLGDAGTVTGLYGPGYYDWGPGNRAGGTRSLFWVEIYGDNLWGFHIFDVKDGIGLEPSDCYPINGNGQLNTIGLKCSVIIWQGVTNGLKTLRLDNIDIPFKLAVEGLADEEDFVELAVKAEKLAMHHGYERLRQIQNRTPEGDLREPLFASIINNGEKEVPSLLVNINALKGQSKGMTTRLCDETRYNCSPCEYKDDSTNDNQRYICSGSNLSPGEKAYVIVDFDDSERDPWDSNWLTNGNTSNSCPAPQQLPVQIFGYDEELLEEKITITILLISQWPIKCQKLLILNC